MKKIDIAFWLNVLVLFPIIIAIGLMAGDFDKGAIPFTIWVILAYAVAEKLQEHVHKTYEAIKRTYSMELRIGLARKAMLKVHLATIAFGLGIAAVALFNYVYRVHIHTKPDADMVFYCVMFAFFNFVYLGGMFYASDLLRKAVES
jgi:hypothetical protein